jgi:hypothetical protein
MFKLFQCFQHILQIFRVNEAKEGRGVTYRSCSGDERGNVEHGAI